MLCRQLEPHRMSDTTAAVYTALWSAFSLLAIAAAVWRRSEVVLFTRQYYRFLAQPWKLSIFGVAWAGFVLMAPYTGDPTWDWFDATFMSVLTFWSSPWAVGVLVRSVQGRSARWQIAPALALWLLSASWLYDAYVWWRDGFYPPTWDSNLVASSVLYVCAGLLWSLTPHAQRGVSLAFLEASWPNSEQRANGKWLWLTAGGFVLFVCAMMSPFLIELWDRVR
jgi:hypothetical protein